MAIISLFIHTYLFILGAALGSFFNVVGLRVPQNQSIVSPGSSCPVCGHRIKPLELVPIFSYIVQKGKCKSCKTSISPIYPVMELITAILFTTSPLMAGWSKELAIAWTLISLCMIVSVSDLAYMIIPDKVLLFFLPLVLIERLFFIPLDPWYDALIGLFAGAFIPFVIILISRGGMGGGDMKLLAVLGVLLGWKLVLLAFFLATVIGTLAGVFGMLLGKVKRGKPFPFGPFLVIGALLAYFFGSSLIQWYTGTFFTY
ncbi:prepilin peptidase [Metabacillus sp. GX 13764]|uniref:prepilin peptidase n=1 Tax=Metabacillus kandeliae TaxID=2900151 RepID=UPI001E652FE8|nr:A24 family peptidase [Metabacillus kandeliae]MCD7032912.1 prepilin peptidase [Metabacillus kandeliae]